jgi:uncharacterized membrane protein
MTPRSAPDDVVDKSRVENLSDGVFAFAITVLVLTISRPTNYAQLAHQLLERWPSYATFVISFLLIGIMWLNHHTILSYVKRVDHAFFYLNLILLMTVAFIPFPAEVFGEALRTGTGERTAAVFFNAVITLDALAFSGLWLHATRERRLLKDDFPEKLRRSSTNLFVAGTGVSIIAIGIALFSPWASLAFDGAGVFFYALDPISKRIDHGAA